MSSCGLPSILCLPLAHQNLNTHIHTCACLHACAHTHIVRHAKKIKRARACSCVPLQATLATWTNWCWQAPWRVLRWACVMQVNRGGSDDQFKGSSMHTCVCELDFQWGSTCSWMILREDWLSCAHFLGKVTLLRGGSIAPGLQTSYAPLSFKTPCTRLCSSCRDQI